MTEQQETTGFGGGFDGLRVGDKVSFDPGLWRRPWHVRAWHWMRRRFFGIEEPPKVLMITSVNGSVATITPAIVAGAALPQEHGRR